MVLKWFKWNSAPETPPEPEPPPPQAQVRTVTLPLAINLSDQAKLDQAKYRLDAIERHIATHPVRDEKMEEFRVEALRHLANLRGAQQIDPAEFKRVMGLLGMEGA